jgi:hypothetical protein
MRAANFAFVGLSALLAARVVSGCSSDQGEPGYDAGTLPDGDLVGDDAGSNEDTGVAPTEDGGGDATRPSGDDGGGSIDDAGGDTSVPEGTDASDAGSEDASDGAAHDVDASDGAASAVDASDGAVGALDASDAASNDVDASDASSTEVDASDASVAVDAGFDASAACATLGGGNPIHGVSSSAPYEDGGIDVMTYALNGGPSGTGDAPAGATVTFQAWTMPADVMSSISVVYFLNGDAGSTETLPLTLAGVDDAGAGAVYQLWTATPPAQTSGTGVTWWVRGTDACHSGVDYYSNNSNNYFYSTQ